MHLKNRSINIIVVSVITSCITVMIYELTKAVVINLHVDIKYFLFLALVITIMELVSICLKEVQVQYYTLHVFSYYSEWHITVPLINTL